MMKGQSLVSKTLLRKKQINDQWTKLFSHISKKLLSRFFQTVVMSDSHIVKLSKNYLNNGGKIMLFILGFVIAIIGILGLVCGVKKNKFSLVFLFSCFCGVGLFMFMIYASPVSDYKYQAFVLQKGYIESHVSKSEIEDAALTAKKVELNQWLFENQSNIGNHPEFYCGIPDGFMEQTPIQ